MGPLAKWFTEREHRLFIAVQLLGTLTALLFFSLALFAKWLPPPGAAVAIIAVVAAAMSVHGQMRGSHKALWMLIIGAFLVIELLAIVHERKEQANQQQKALQDERKHFGEIGHGIEAAIANSDRQFQKTMNKENSVLGTTKSIAELARKNLESISGEGSIPCIVPQSHAVFNGVVPLVVWNKGVNNLTGVEIRILSLSEFLDQGSIFYKPSANLGTLRPEWPKPLPEAITPHPGYDGIANYTAEIWTQNGYYTETINFRRGKYQVPWAYQYWLYKQIPFRPKNPLAHGMKATPIVNCRSSEWSDDLGDGKPAKQP